MMAVAGTFVAIQLTNSENEKHPARVIVECLMFTLIEKCEPLLGATCMATIPDWQSIGEKRTVKPSEIDFPVWMIFRVDSDSATSGQPVCAFEESRGRCLPIFTDTDLAERFIAAKVHHETHVLKEVKGLDILCGIVKHVTNGGCKYVAVDSFIGRGFSNAYLIPVSDFEAISGDSESDD